MRKRLERLICLALIPALLTGSNEGFAASGPQRVVSMNLCADEVLLRVAAPGQVMAVTRLEKTPEAETLLNQNPAVKRLRGGLEEILAFEPDLVLSSLFGQRVLNEALIKQGIHVLALPVPENFEEIYAGIRAVADAVKRVEQGRLLITAMQADLEREQGAETGIKGIFYQRGSYVPGARTFEDALLRAAGIRNLAAEAGIRGYGKMSLERLFVEKPDLMIFASDHRSRSSIDSEILSHPAIVRGLKDTRTETLPAYLLNCGSPASVDAVKRLREMAVSRGMKS